MRQVKGLMARKENRKDSAMTIKRRNIISRKLVVLRSIIKPLPLSLLALLFAVVGLAGYATHRTTAAGVADQIHYTITGPNSVSFDWRGDANTISYGTSTAYGSTVTAHGPLEVKEDGTSTTMNPTDGTGPFREADLTNLQPGTTYHYSIGGSADETFHTAPPKGSSNFVIAAEGDTGNAVGFKDFQTIQNQVAAANPDLVLGLGDYDYSNGDPNNGFIEGFFGNASLGSSKPGIMAFSKTAPFLPAWGNHEIDHANDNGRCTGNNLSNYKARFNFPNPMEDGTSEYCYTGGGEDWWWLDYGNVRIISAPEPWSDDWRTWHTKADPIMAAAQSDPNIDYIITTDHRPAYSSGYHPGESQFADATAALASKYSKYVLALNGHSHDLEVTNPTKTNGVTYVTSGGGGGYLENGSCSNGWNSVNGSCNLPSWDAWRSMHYGFLKLTVTKTGMTGQMVCGPDGGESKYDSACTPGSVNYTFTIGSPSTGGGGGGGGGSAGDTTAPTVSMTAPANNSTVSGTINVSANASDTSGIKQVQFFDGSTLLGTDTSSPYSVNWDTTTASGGIHTLTAVATDNSSNQNTATSSATTVTVSNGCPALPTTYGSSTTQVSVQAGTYRVWTRVMVPDSTNNSYYFQLGNGCASNIGDDSAIPANQWTWIDYKDGDSTSKANVTVASSGSQNVVLTGRETGVRIDRILLVGDNCVPTGTGDNCLSAPDTSAPTNVAITSPTNGSNVSGQVTISGTASDNTGVSRVDFYDGSSLIGSSTQPSSGTTQDGTWQLTWNADASSAGSHTLTMKATDGTNTTTSDPVAVSTGQTNAPLVSITSPHEGDTVQGNVAVQATATAQQPLTKAELYVNGTLKDTSTSGSSPFTLHWDTSGLAGGSYSLVVKAYDNASPANVGSSQPVNVTIGDSQPPSVPTNFDANASPGRIDLSWTASTGDVKGYQVLRNGTVIANPTDTTYADIDVTANTTYTYAVKSFDAAGNVSDASTSVTVTTPPQVADSVVPTAPSLLVATANGPTSVTLNWSASTDNVGVVQYVIVRSFHADVGVVGQTTGTTFTDTTASPKSDYGYTVFAVDAAQNVSDPSNFATVSTPDTATTDTSPPTKPDEFGASVVSPTQINFIWSASTDNVGVVGYELWRDNTKLGTTTSRSFGDTSFAPNTQYEYRLYAIDAAGNKSAPAVVHITTPSDGSNTGGGGGGNGGGGDTGGGDNGGDNGSGDEGGGSGTNFVLNDGFESNLKGWNVLEKSSLKFSLANVGHTGDHAARLKREHGTGDATLNDSPDWVKPVPSDATQCTASAWVKTNQHGVTINIRIRDYQGNTRVGYYAHSLKAPDGRWHQISVSAPIKSSDDDFDLNIYAKDLRSGNRLLVDDVQETCS